MIYLVIEMFYYESSDLLYMTTNLPDAVDHAKRYYEARGWFADEIQVRRAPILAKLEWGVNYTVEWSSREGTMQTIERRRGNAS